MRIPLLFVFAAAVAAANVVTAQSVSAGGRWCYSNETDHCDQPSFESCHFGTLGNGGYCYANSHGRSAPSSHDYALHAASAGPSRTGRWCYSNEDDHCDQPSFESCLYSTFGNGGYCYFEAARRAHRTEHIQVARAQRTHRIEKPSDAMASAGSAGLSERDAPCLADGGAENADCGAEVRTAFAATPRQALNTTVQRNASATVGGPPTLNIVPSCRAAAAISLGSGQAMDVCLAGENQARDQLAEQWNEYSRAERSSCIGLATIGGGGTYTALLTCLEMKQFARSLPKTDSTVMLASR